jgi:hypothetical protein
MATKHEGRIMSAIGTDHPCAQWEIIQVLQRYCRAMDRIDAELGHSVWHEDGLADYGEVFRGTGRGFIDWACAYHRTLDAQSHQIGIPLICVRGDKAHSETYVTATLLFRKDGRQWLTTGRARYVDSWSRRAGCWAIDERISIHDFSITQDVAASMGNGTRGADDPSYAVFGVVRA